MPDLAGDVLAVALAAAGPRALIVEPELERTAERWLIVALHLAVGDTESVRDARRFGLIDHPVERAEIEF